MGDLFEIESTLSFNKDVLVEGIEYDYVTRTSQNQGVLQTTGFVNNENINPSGNWSLGLLQMDFFYREKPWYAGQFVRRVTPKIEIKNRSGILFLSTLLNKQKQNLLSVLVRNVDKTFRNTKISLPTKNGELDFDFMENFISQLEAYLLVTDLKDYTLNNEENQVLIDFYSGKVRWGEFEIGEIFNIATGRDVIIGNVESGSLPLVSHQHENNGITKYVKRLENRRLFSSEDTIALADRGIFYATTQREDFHIGTRVKALSFKTGNKDVKTRLFYTTSINMLQSLFMDYSDNATNKLPIQKIQLPVKNNDPDYDYMALLISAVQKLVIKDVVLYADRKIAATKQVIEGSATTL